MEELKPKKSKTWLLNVTKTHLRALSIDQKFEGTTIDALDEAAVAYLENLKTFKLSPTRKVVLEALEKLARAPDKKMPAIVSKLPGDAVRSMFNLYPGAAMSVAEGLSGDEWSPVPHLLGVEVATLKNLFARQYQNNDVVLAAVKGHPFPMEIGAEPTKENIKTLAITEPNTVRIWAASRLEMMIDIFQVRDGKGGRNVKIVSGAVPKVDWFLVSAVKSIVWPRDKGPLHSRKMKNMREIIESVKIYARGENVRLKDDAKPIFNQSILSHVNTLDNQMWMLTESIRFLERRIDEVVRSSLSGHAAYDRLYRLEHMGLYALIYWLEELERRFRFGDDRAFRPNKFQHGDGTIGRIRRQTGPVLETPTFPVITKDMNIVRRTLALRNAARPWFKSREKRPRNKLAASEYIEVFSPGTKTDA